jgi:hypothetical protein
VLSKEICDKCRRQLDLPLIPRSWTDWGCIMHTVGILDQISDPPAGCEYKLEHAVSEGMLRDQ